MRETYYDLLREQIIQFKTDGTEFDETIIYVPDLFRFLADLLDQEVLDREARIMIDIALAYFVAPGDVLPEDAYGAMGYIDDMFVCCHVLKTLLPQYQSTFLSLWKLDENMEEVLDRCYNYSSRFLDDKGLKGKVMRYSGLSE